MPCPHPGGPAVHLEALRRELAGQGSCWYWWLWATRIAPGGDAALAADRITSVLRAADSGPVPSA